MKHPKPASSNPDDGLQLELGRLRAMHHVHDATRILTNAMHHVHDATRILTNAMHYVEPDRRLAYAAIVVGLTTLERHITDLAPKS